MTAMRVLWAVLWGCLLLADELPPGQIINEVTAASDAAQRYSLYLPSAYTADKKWPVVLAFDPGGRGRRAVEQYQAAAEKFGYIIAASNVSRNGSWAVSMGAAQAMGEDVTARFTINRQRVYTAGMSGGARVALGVALGAEGVVAGVIASSAGYPDSKPRQSVPFPSVGTAGTDDFHWLEMKQLDHALTTPHRVAIFEGGHVWLSSALALEALEWMDLQAMKSGRLPRDAARLEVMFAARQVKAMALAHEGQSCLALESLAADFDGLHDVTELNARTSELRRSKAVKEAWKKDQAEEQKEQVRINEILRLEQGLNAAGARVDALARLTDEWKSLAKESAAAKDSAERRIARRISRGLAMGSAGRTKDAEYLKVLATYRPARTGPPQ